MRYFLVVVGLLAAGFGFFTFTSPSGAEGNDQLGTAFMIVGAVMFSTGCAVIDVVATLERGPQNK